MTPIRLALLIAPLLFSNFPLASTEADGMVLQVQASGETQDWSDYENDSPYTHTEDGRLISKDVKKTRIYIVVDKSESMDKFSPNVASAAQSLVRGLDDKQCADYEIRVVELGEAMEGTDSRPLVLNREFITQDTPNGMGKLTHHLTSYSQLSVRSEAPLHSLMSGIEGDLGTFEEVDLVAGIILTDALLLSETFNPEGLKDSIESMTGKPFTSYSLNLFSDTKACFPDVTGGDGEADQLQRRYFEDCFYTRGRSQRECNQELLDRIAHIEAAARNDPSTSWINSLIEFTNASGGSSMNLCSNNFDFEFMAITNAILEKMGCQLYYLSEDLDAAQEQKDTRFL